MLKNGKGHEKFLIKQIGDNENFFVSGRVEMIKEVGKNLYKAI